MLWKVTIERPLNKALGEKFVTDDYYDKALPAYEAAAKKTFNEEFRRTDGINFSDHRFCEHGKNKYFEVYSNEKSAQLITRVSLTPLEETTEPSCEQHTQPATI